MGPQNPSGGREWRVAAEVEGNTIELRVCPLLELLDGRLAWRGIKLERRADSINVAGSVATRTGPMFHSCFHFKHRVRRHELHLHLLYVIR